MVAAAILAISVEPRISVARQLVAKGDFKAARAELGALGRETDAQLAPLWAQVRLRETLAETDAERAAGLAGQIPASRPEAAEARTHVDALRLGAAKAALERGEYKVARGWIDRLAPPLRDGPEVRQLVVALATAEGDACLAGADWPCAVARAKEASAQGDEEHARTLRAAALAGSRGRVEELLVRFDKTQDIAGRIAGEEAALKAWAEYQAVEPTAIAALLRANQEGCLAAPRSAAAFLCT
jgi:hypothetical protein